MLVILTGAIGGMVLSGPVDLFVGAVVLARACKMASGLTTRVKGTEIDSAD